MTWTPQDGRALTRIADTLQDIRDVLIEATTPGMGIAPLVAASTLVEDGDLGESSTSVCPMGCAKDACMATFGNPCQMRGA